MISKKEFNRIIKKYGITLGELPAFKPEIMNSILAFEAYCKIVKENRKPKKIDKG